MTNTNLPDENQSYNTCNISECGAKVLYRNLCGKHYNNLRKANVLPKVKFDDYAESFWVKTEKSENESDCWRWLAFKDKHGYGRMKCNGKNEMAHRVSFFIHNGYWATDFVLHSCDNPECCNPKHLREGTAAENAADCVKRGRRPYPAWLLEPKQPKPQRCSLSDLSKEEFEQIKSSLAKGHIKKYIAERFNITPTLLKHIITE